MRKITIFATCALGAICLVLSSGNASADEPTPDMLTSTTVAENFDKESGMYFTVIDDQTIEISLPD